MRLATAPRCALPHSCFPIFGLVICEKVAFGVLDVHFREIKTLKKFLPCYTGDNWISEFNEPWNVVQIRILSTTISCVFSVYKFVSIISLFVTWIYSNIEYWIFGTQWSVICRAILNKTCGILLFNPRCEYKLGTTNPLCTDIPYKEI